MIHTLCRSTLRLHGRDDILVLFATHFHDYLVVVQTLLSRDDDAKFSEVIAELRSAHEVLQCVRVFGADQSGCLCASE
jgi:hypothetical protein